MCKIYQECPNICIFLQNTTYSLISSGNNFMSSRFVQLKHLIDDTMHSLSLLLSKDFELFIFYHNAISIEDTNRFY